MANKFETPGQSFPPAEGTIHFDILKGNLGFHYTITRALPAIFEHGLLSQNEERKRGLRVRVKGSARSFRDGVYFTKKADDVYVVRDGDKSAEDILGNIVGIGIDKSRHLHHDHPHFYERDFVDPSRFSVLVFPDIKINDESFDPLSTEGINARVAELTRICQEHGIELPIYGTSGEMYAPERRSRIDILMMLRAGSATTENLTEG